MIWGTAYCACTRCAVRVTYQTKPFADGERAVGEWVLRDDQSATGFPFCPGDTLADWASATSLRRQTANTSIESADASSLRSFAPAVSMMKAAEPGTGDHRRSRPLDGPAQMLVNADSEQRPTTGQLSGWHSPGVTARAPLEGDNRARLAPVDSNHEKRVPPSRRCPLNGFVSPVPKAAASREWGCDFRPRFSVIPVIDRWPATWCHGDFVTSDPSPQMIAA